MPALRPLRRLAPALTNNRRNIAGIPTRRLHSVWLLDDASFVDSAYDPGASGTINTTYKNVSLVEASGAVSFKRGVDCNVLLGSIINIPTLTSIYGGANIFGSAFTITAWFAPGSSAAGKFINLVDNAAKAAGIGYLSAQFYIDAPGGAQNGYINPTGVFTTGLWYHVAGTYDGGTTYTLYINGVSQALSSNAAISVGVNGCFGARDQSNTNGYTGKLARITLHEAVLTADEVNQIYLSGLRNLDDQFEAINTTAVVTPSARNFSLLWVGP